MADHPDARQQVMPAVVDPHAPFIYFEIAPALGHANGVFSVTLTANRTYPGKDGIVVNEQVAVAYLRGNAAAFMSLRHAIDNAILMAAPTAEGKAN
jgi:hypothetical protein